MEESILKEIGLNEAEIKIYVVLIKFGELSVREISEKSGLYRPYVYDNLTKLTEKGLVTTILKTKKSFYKAVNPLRILESIDEKKRKLTILVKELEEQYKEKKSDYEVDTLEGEEGLKTFYNLLYQELKKFKIKELLVFGGTGEAVKFLRFYFPNFLKRAFLENTRKKIKIKMIYNSNAKKSEIAKNYGKLINFKFTKKEEDLDSTTILYGDKVAIMVLKERPFIILISNKHIAETNKKIFERLWSISDNSIEG
jgi:HTH-type transcriptional regulator, sugar sensing transcriptional regulator